MDTSTGSEVAEDVDCKGGEDTEFIMYLGDIPKNDNGQCLTVPVMITVYV